MQNYITGECAQLGDRILVNGTETIVDMLIDPPGGIGIRTGLIWPGQARLLEREYPRELRRQRSLLVWFRA